MTVRAQVVDNGVLIDAYVYFADPALLFFQARRHLLFTAFKKSLLRQNLEGYHVFSLLAKAIRLQLKAIRRP